MLYEKLMNNYQAEILIVGGGLAGIVAAYELLDRKKKILLIEKGTQDKLGGLAKESFGGIHFINSPEQRRMGIQDCPALGFKDWEQTADFTPSDEWGRKWAKFYCDNSIEYIYQFLVSKRIRFLPVVNWAERGLFLPGNTVPRWHIAWGTGFEIVERLLNALAAHKNRDHLQILFEHEVSSFDVINRRVVGVLGKKMKTQEPFRASAEHVVIASGGMCGGDLSKIRQNWFKQWGQAPQHLLNGSHIYADGQIQDQVQTLGGSVIHLDRQWLYAAGVAHPAKRKPQDGLSLVPPKSALWMNASGERIGPIPLISGVDTRFLVESVARQPDQYSWQVLNWKIAVRELAVSGSDYMTAFRNKSKLQLFKQFLFGNKELIERLVKECPDDFLLASNVAELVEKMNAKSLGQCRISLETMEKAIRSYDDQIDRGKAYFNDDQLRRLANYRSYPGDRFRICKFQKILCPNAKPLMAIRLRLLSRKSLGGIQTDLACRVLDTNQNPIEGLYAIGEAAGFGGGGIHGFRSLEGTFLGSCVLTARVLGKTL